MYLRTALVLLISAQALAAQADPKRISSEPSAKKRETTPGAVLSESYYLAKDLVPVERAILLNYLSLTAGQHHLACTADWAQENFLLARQLPMNWNRLAIEKNSLVALSYVRPARAMVLLRSMELPISDGNGFREDVRSDAAKTIFQNYWRVHKPKGLTEIQQEAAYLGQTGQYPYRAIQGIVADLPAGDPKGQGPISPAAQSLVLDAYTFFQRGSKFDVEQDDFVEFLRTLHPILPPSLLKQGLELAVERLFDSDRRVPAQKYVSHVQTDKGTATFHHREQALLFDLLPLIRQVDPEWAAEIVQRDEALRQAQGNAGRMIASDGITSPGEGETEFTAEQTSGLEQSRSEAAARLAQTDPVAGLQMVETIANPSIRATAWANIANIVGQSAPEQAEEIEKQIQNVLPSVNNAEDRLEALSAVVKAAAAARDVSTFREALGRCFVLGEELFQENSDTHPTSATYESTSYNVLADVVRSGVSREAETTTSRVRELRNIALRAYLLYTAADALYSAQGNTENRRDSKVQTQLDSSIKVHESDRSKAAHP